MTDRLDFEARFAGRLAAHAADAVRPFDAAAIAASVAAGTRGGGAPGDSRRFPRPMAWLVLGLLILAAAAAAMAVGERSDHPPAPVLGRFEPIGAQADAVSAAIATATTLVDGKVLVAGCPSRLYDPLTRTTTGTAPMVDCRTGHAAVALDDGRVLIVGGAGVDPLTSAELFDPTTASFSRTGSSLVARRQPSAVRLHDGRVLVLGGQADQGADLAATAERFDPRTGTFARSGSSGIARIRPTMTVLADGRVLVAGGEGVAPHGGAELYDPATGRFTPAGAMSAPRLDFTATLLADGRVLFAGGYTAMTTDGSATMAATGEIYDPATDTFSPTGPMVVPRWMHAAARLRDGRVLVVGGTVPRFDGGRNLRFVQAGIADAEVFDPSTNTFSRIASMGSPRIDPLVTTLADGDVLILGHQPQTPSGSPSGPQLTGELFR